MMKTIHSWKILLQDRAYVISLLMGLGILFFANWLNIASSTYNDTKTYLSVGDIILQNLPVVNMEFFFSWGMYILFTLALAYVFFWRPEILPFSLKTFALLIIVRAGFILLTNIGPPEDFYYEGGVVGGNFISDFIFRNDLFFSGHTAYPFLGFLIFKDSHIRWVFLFGSVLMGITVLLMHVHYSIDVFAAFFIAYGTYAASELVFKKLNLRFSSRLKLLMSKVLHK